MQSPDSLSSPASSGNQGGTDLKKQRGGEKSRKDLDSAILVQAVPDSPNKNVVQLPMKDLASADAVLTITMEQLCSVLDRHMPFFHRAAKRVHYLTDEMLEHDVFYLFSIQREYRLWFALEHKDGSKLPFDVRSVKLSTPDGICVKLNSFNGADGNGDSQAVALMDHACQISPYFNMPSPVTDDVETRFVKLRLTVELEIGEEKVTHTIFSDIYCQMVIARDFRTSPRVLGTDYDPWREVPRWIKDVANGAVVPIKYN